MTVPFRLRIDATGAPFEREARRVRHADECVRKQGSDHDTVPHPPVRNILATVDQALAQARRARRHKCEVFSSKRLPNRDDLRNMRVLGSDIAATKQVAE